MVQLGAKLVPQIEKLQGYVAVSVAAEPCTILMGHDTLEPEPEYAVVAPVLALVTRRIVSVIFAGVRNGDTF
jgi:hypothetical protein